MQKVTVSSLRKMKQQGEKITMLTVYDATFAKLFSEQGLDILFIGDTLGQVVQGHDSTVPVKIEDMVYHTECVARGNYGRSLVMADMPFMTYAQPQQAMENAAKLMQAGAQVVKMEGERWLVETVAKLSERGVPTCVHMGLIPQSVHMMGGYKVQGRERKRAQELLEDALALEQAGAVMIVLECVPHTLASEISMALNIPVIGIGAGNGCDGQVLVYSDMLGLNGDKPFTFVRNFMADQSAEIGKAIKSYIDAVKQGEFPTEEHSFS